MTKSAATGPSPDPSLLLIKANASQIVGNHTWTLNMKLPKSQNQKSIPKRYKNRLTEEQLRLLEASFNHEKKLEPERKFQLAYELGMPPKQVAIWYQNKRARWKTQNIELDYRAIQLRLESVLADRGRLQREVGRLSVELQKAHEILLSLNLTTPPLNSVSTSCEEDGSSSFPSDANCHWKNTEVLQVEDLYACLMGRGSSYDVK
ncbi:hypothetical protein IFM89_014403 [Coptis chinensis]|uniref:Homeobox-leucine zipper protein n=1 Tax=Coptis chinensis TaxID=261450 RepID=A0A835LDQ0_9MAGN|nr:hypothetical protein IFM89_014403 [Coptis chinensis]